MAKAEVRRQELARIYKRDGSVRASVLVKESKPKSAPLHDEFEWDDRLAASEYRLIQGRRIIRTTVYRDAAGVESRFVNVPSRVVYDPTAQETEREGYYKPIPVVAKCPSEYEAALKQIMRQRAAMEETIRALHRAAKKEGKEVNLVSQLADAMDVVKRTLHLLAQAG